MESEFVIGMEEAFLLGLLIGIAFGMIFGWVAFAPWSGEKNDH